MMGQGAESCGGYDVEFDEYEENLSTGMWVQKDGSLISPSKMTVQHLKNAKRLCINLSECETYSCESDKWMEWVDIFNLEIASRSPVKKSHLKPKTKTAQRGSKAKMKCHCGSEYEAREADLKRGWAKSCSKRCASIKREYGRPDSTRL